VVGQQRGDDQVVPAGVVAREPQRRESLGGQDRYLPRSIHENRNISPRNHPSTY
jgi:hypothetical protein